MRNKGQCELLMTHNVGSALLHFQFDQRCFKKRLSLSDAVIEKHLGRFVFNFI
jgi:hypothetical protein